MIDSEPLPSLEENVKVIKKVAEKIGQKFETPSYDVIADVKEAVYDTIEENGQLHVDSIAQKYSKIILRLRWPFKKK